MALDPKPTSREETERWISKYLSSHYRPEGWQEAYDFNIKVRMIDIPDIARRKFSQDTIDQMIQVAMADRLRDFVYFLLRKYPWIKDWTQEGQMGGWLVLITDDAVRDAYGEIPKTKATLAKAKRRLRDLFAIEESIKENIKSMKQEFLSPKWWGWTPLDWLPGVTS